MWVSELLRLVVLGYITKSMVLVSPSVKICDFFSFPFFSFFFSPLVCRMCRRSEKKKTKRHSPDTGIRRVIPIPVSDTKNGMSVQPRREKGGGGAFSMNFMEHAPSRCQGLDAIASLVAVIQYLQYNYITTTSIKIVQYLQANLETLYS